MLRKLFAWAKPTRPTLPLAERTPVTTDGSDGFMRARQPITDISDTDFDAMVLTHPTLVVVDFWAEWCQPCTIMSAYVGFLAQDFGDALHLVALDVDENPLTPEQYQVMGLPTLLFFHHGQEVGRVVGVTTYEELQAQVKALLTTPT